MHFFINIHFQVVGGLAWSIQACNFAVDIDVLYQENASLGQKMYMKKNLLFFF
jgi:hypothetical protein